MKWGKLVGRIRGQRAKSKNTVGHRGKRLSQSQSSQSRSSMNVSVAMVEWEWRQAARPESCSWGKCNIDALRASGDKQAQFTPGERKWRIQQQFLLQLLVIYFFKCSSSESSFRKTSRLGLQFVSHTILSSTPQTFSWLSLPAAVSDVSCSHQPVTPVQ